ncbi:hypothetical protein GWK47_049083 [Chionoecetes opilio]|uniref:Uncharacterized protein n=1 Tax=Chionoecetes opilio TaxID=41210 RepID=A0A8J5CRV7_CHIOP|nr:hypothetical protein GWK47_049083 [Chionoecetes opilio]
MPSEYSGAQRSPQRYQCFPASRCDNDFFLSLERGKVGLEAWGPIREVTYAFNFIVEHPMHKSRDFARSSRCWNVPTVRDIYKTSPSGRRDEVKKGNWFLQKNKRWRKFPQLNRPCWQHTKRAVYRLGTRPKTCHQAQHRHHHF